MSDDKQDQKDQQDPAQEAALGDAGKRALQQEREGRKAAEKRAKEAEDRIADYERSALVSEIVTEKGLPSSLARRLAGSTREELEADADDLLSILKPEETASAGIPGKPKERLRGGGDPTETPDADASTVADRIIGRP